MSLKDQLPQITVNLTTKGGGLIRFNSVLIRKAKAQDRRRCILTIDKSARVMHFEFSNDPPGYGYKLSEESGSFAKRIQVSLKATNVKSGKYPAYQSKSDENCWFTKY